MLKTSSFLNVFYFITVKQKLGFHEKRSEPYIGRCVLCVPLELSETASHGSFSLNWGAWARQAPRAHLCLGDISPLHAKACEGARASG